MRYSNSRMPSLVSCSTMTVRLSQAQTEHLIAFTPLLGFADQLSTHVPLCNRTRPILTLDYRVTNSFIRVCSIRCSILSSVKTLPSVAWSRRRMSLRRTLNPLPAMQATTS